jgi:fluoride exporter
VNAVLAIALGGAIGSVARYAVVLFARGLTLGFPLGTLLVNVVGSFAIGLLGFWLASKLPDADNWRNFLLTGMLGGFTTFSAFSLDTLLLVQNGRSTSAVVYVLLSVFGSLAAVFVGYQFAKLIAYG